MLNEEKALELARRLTIVPDFPMYSEAIEAVAEDLVMLAETAPSPDVAEARARWLVTEIRRTWTRWSGTVDMVALYQKRFDPPVTPSNQVKDWGTKPPIQCRICNDTGVVKQEGRFCWCDCEIGIYLHFDLPDWLDTLNRFQPEPVKPPEVQIANNPIHPATEKEIVKSPNCPACADTRSHTHQEYWQHHTKQEMSQ